MTPAERAWKMAHNIENTDVVALSDFLTEQITEAVAEALPRWVPLAQELPKNGLIAVGVWDPDSHAYGHTKTFEYDYRRTSMTWLMASWTHWTTLPAPPPKEEPDVGTIDPA